MQRMNKYKPEHETVNHRYFAVYKPFGVISQFSEEGGHKTLKDCFSVPKDVYPVGRLDTDSEGLLILTNDNHLKHKLLDPHFKHRKTYWVQVEGNISTDAIEALKSGVEISIKGKKHTSLPAKANLLPAEKHSSLPERTPPIRFRKNIPDSWLELQITEGKNRQVRRMTAKVGFPTLRLVRYGIENLSIKDLNPGDIIEYQRDAIYKYCNIKAKK